MIKNRKNEAYKSNEKDAWLQGKNKTFLIKQN